MQIEELVFQKKRICFSKLLEFGFVKKDNVFVYTTKFLEHNFLAEIVVTSNGNVSGKVYDLDMDEEYVQIHYVNGISSFTRVLQAEYISILEAIANACCDDKLFVADQSNRVVSFVYDKYQVTPDFPFANDDCSGVQYHKAFDIDKSLSVVDFLEKNNKFDKTKFSWDRVQKDRDIRLGTKYKYSENSLYKGVYRPFQKQYSYFNKNLNSCLYQQPKLFPYPKAENLMICTSGLGDNNFTSLISNNLPDLHLTGSSQCFPLYYYEKVADSEQKTKVDISSKYAHNEDLFAEEGLIFEDKKPEKPQKNIFIDDEGNKYERKSGITDWILKEFRTRLNAKTITKEQIFYYVYGLLHAPDYRKQFELELRKSLPRIPIVETIEDFIAFRKAGENLAKLHLEYESIPAYEGVTIKTTREIDNSDFNTFKVEKMKFPKKNQKDTIIYNGVITVENIPAKAYEYVVNGKSAIEWIMERYQVTIDKDSLIKNDPNDWSLEHNQPRYILDLLLSIINVSVQTVDIVNSLPKLKL